ncbi:MAG: DsbC family protein [Rubrivivax sp.]|nr:DsbC family protein [Rubrivivax sp.]
MTLTTPRALLWALLLIAAGAAAALALNRAWRALPADAASAVAAAAAASVPVSGDPRADAVARVLVERIPRLPPIDEVQPSPVPGWWQVRFGGTEILYADDGAEHILVGGTLIETKTRSDLTEAALSKALAVAWDQLPLQDAIVFRQGSGERVMAVFVDPNCGYCKRFERDLTGIRDVTIYAFLIPILGPDSEAKSRDIWCAKDRGAAWRGWMLDGVVPPRAMGACDTAAIERNLAFSRSHRINGTPAVFFADGTRKPGALPPAEVERLLAAAGAPPRK